MNVAGMVMEKGVTLMSYIIDCVLKYRVYICSVYYNRLTK